MVRFLDRKWSFSVSHPCLDVPGRNNDSLLNYYYHYYYYDLFFLFLFFLFCVCYIFVIHCYIAQIELIETLFASQFASFWHVFKVHSNTRERAKLFLSFSNRGLQARTVVQDPRDHRELVVSQVSWDSQDPREQLWVVTPSLIASATRKHTGLLSTAQRVRKGVIVLDLPLAALWSNAFSTVYCFHTTRPVSWSRLFLKYLAVRAWKKIK